MNLGDEIAHILLLFEDSGQSIKDATTAILALIDRGTGYKIEETCYRCVGEKQIFAGTIGKTEPCRVCHGTGTITRPLTFQEMKKAIDRLTVYEATLKYCFDGKVIKKVEEERDDWKRTDCCGTSTAN
jgi:hypothetical protein